MRSRIGSVVTIAGFLCLLVFGFWAFMLALRILTTVGGFWLALMGFLLFPVMLTFAPFYAAAAWGDWTPLLVTYGGGATAYGLIGTGLKFSKGS